MLQLELEHDYLTVDTSEWLDDRSTLNDELTARLIAFLEGREESYATSDAVTAWLEILASESEYDPTVTGIYGEDGPVSVATCNMDTFLSSDISYVFAHAGDHTLMIVTGSGYFLHSPAYVEVRDFTGDDDADAFDYARGWLSHDTYGREKCGTEWILDDTVRMWRNGGAGDMPRIDECIMPAADETPRIVCPDCGDTLTASVG